jgi:hypothetical protein
LAPLALFVRSSPSIAVFLLAFCALNTSSKATATETHACFVFAFRRRGFRAVRRHRGSDSRNWRGLEANCWTFLRRRSTPVRWAVRHSQSKTTLADWAPSCKRGGRVTVTRARGRGFVCGSGRLMSNALPELIPPLLLDRRSRRRHREPRARSTCG